VTGGAEDTRLARCVWITEDQRDVLVALQEHREHPNVAVAEILAAFESSPADPEEAVRAVIHWPPIHPPLTTTGAFTDQHIAAVLVALGFPARDAT
jgi:hypothetical protein